MDFNNIEDLLKDLKSSSVAVIANYDKTPAEDDEKVELDGKEIPILPLRNMMLFPGTLLPVAINRNTAKALLTTAENTREYIGVFGQKDENNDAPSSTKDLCKTGVLARVMKVIKLPDGTQTAFIQGKERIRLIEAHDGGEYLVGAVESFPEERPARGDRRFEVTIDMCKEVADKFLRRGDDQKMQLDSSFKLTDMSSRIFFVNFLCSSLPLTNTEHLALLEKTNLHDRATLVLQYLNRELQFAMLKANIQMQTQEDLNRQQREYFLKKEIENIREELGDDTERMEIEMLKIRAAEKKWGEEIARTFNKEVERLERQNRQSPDYAQQYDYLNTLLEMPWNEFTKDQLDLNAAQRQLDRDHFGMEKVKERIIEHLAVLKMRGDMKSPILCLYGPPGVGKTSLGKSIAKAMKRKYVRVSLGGLHDEAEIRGHRRTYIGAMPGRIIKGMLTAKSSNPVFILDEIDKVSQNDFHGDPTSALLEVLDPEQNKAFHDNYIDLDYDISNVMFIATANNISNIPAPLLDRMELIEVSGYLTEEKVEIARKHLLPKQIENVGLKRSDVKLSKAAIERIIEDYTRESGVRALEKQLNKVMRKVALQRARSTEEELAEATAINIKPNDIATWLGTQPYSRDLCAKEDTVGVVTGLAWTAVGGEILFVETSLSRGKGEKLTLTGNLGDVMKESAMLAHEYIKAHADTLGLTAEKLGEWNIHLHVPEGAVPKDGPSAGITMATSIASALTGRKVRHEFAMTGEITLRGKVLPVGGIKEKILAAKRSGITHIILCAENERNIKDIPEQYVKGVTFHYVNTVEEVLELALIP